MSLETSADDVLSVFNVTDEARRQLEEWSNDPSRRETVVPHVLAHRTQALYKISLDDVGAIRRKRGGDDHALGEIKRWQAERVQRIVNWYPGFAFTHVFHYALEQIGHLYTWQEFRWFCFDDPKANAMLWSPAKQENAECMRHQGWSYDDVYKAMRWRVGNFYYSFIREVHVIAWLRAHGLEVRSHPLADALYRVDAWHERTALSIYVGNKKFKEGDKCGRKPRPEKILKGADPEFSFYSMELAPADEYGIVYLATEAALQKVANDLRSGAVSQLR